MPGGDDMTPWLIIALALAGVLLLPCVIITGWVAWQIYKIEKRDRYLWE